MDSDQAYLTIGKDTVDISESECCTNSNECDGLFMICLK